MKAVAPEQGATSSSSKASTRDDYQDPEKIRILFDRALDDAKGNIARQPRDRQDMQNLLMYRGGSDNQWSALNTATGRYEPIPTDGPDGIPEYVLRCTTNKLARKIDGIVSILNNSEGAKLFVPSTDDDEDRATAEVAEDADPVLLQEIRYDTLKRRVHQLIALTDKIAFVVWYDNDEKYGLAPIELYQCQDCGELLLPMETGGTPVDEMAEREAEDPDAQPNLECKYCQSNNVAPAIDKSNGIPIGVDYPKGKICADFWCSYEFSIPSTARVADADEVTWVLGHQRMAVEEACGSWTKHAERIRSQVGMTSSVGSSPLANQYAEEMRTLSSPRAGTHSGDGGRGTVMVYRLQHDPIEDDEVSFPDGLHAVMVGEIIVDANPLPIKGHDGCPRKSILLRQFADTPGTPYGKPPCDDLTPLQKQRNQHEALIYLSHLLHASPRIFIPDTVELLDEITGDPWSPIRYRTSVPGNKPSMERGMSPPESLYKTIEAIDAAMEDISGLNSVLGGARPQGDPTLGEVEILQERGMAAFRTPLVHQTSFEEKLSRMLLDLARETAWFPRFRKTQGENGQWNISQFTAADLQGAIDITIDPVSAWPKSPTMEMMKLERAVKLGVLNAAQDPEAATKILTTLGLAHLKPSLDADRKYVSRLLDRWKAAIAPAEIEPPELDVIDPPIVLYLVKQFMKGEGAEAIKTQNRPLYDAMLGYVQALKAALMPAAPPTPGGPQANGAVQAAIDSGALVPSGAAPQPPAPQDPVQAALASGALLPSAAAAPTGPTGPSIDELLDAGALTPAPPPVAGAPKKPAP